MQPLLRTFPTPSSACCLQYTAVLLPSTLKLDGLVQKLLLAKIDTDVCHAVFSMLTALQRGLAALDIEPRSPRSGIMQATLAVDVHKNRITMLLAVHRLHAAFDIETRLPCAEAM